MKRRVPKQQPKMDFPAKNIFSGPIPTVAPPRPPFEETYSIISSLLGGIEPSPQPSYPYPSARRWRY